MVVGCFNKAVEGVRSGYVGEVRAACGVDGPALGLHNDLAQLRPGDVVAPAEGAVGVAADEAAVVGCLDEAVERVGRGHICEVRTACRCRWRSLQPAQRSWLAGRGSSRCRGGRCRPSSRRSRRGRPGAYGSVEVVGGLHVAEVDGAGLCCRGGGSHGSRGRDCCRRGRHCRGGRRLGGRSGGYGRVGGRDRHMRPRLLPVRRLWGSARCPRCRWRAP